MRTGGSACNNSVSCNIVDGTAVIQRSSQSCPVLPPDCPPASVRPDPSGCCEICVRCRDRGNRTRNIGDFWKADSCTTCTCQEDGGVSCTTRDCPPLDPDCPPQFVSTDSSGCCPRCNRPEELGETSDLSQPLYYNCKTSHHVFLPERCSVQAVPTTETGPGSIELKVAGHSECRNIEMVNNWNTCKGTCSSGSFFDSGFCGDK